MKTKEFILPKNKLPHFFEILQNNSDEIIAPVKNMEDPFLRMQPVESVENICFEGISWFTSKKYVFPEKKTLFKFKGEKIEIPDNNFPKRVLFGLRLCDLNAFHINDELFLNQDPAFPGYKEFRENLTLVGLWCHEPQDEYCFCDSMKLKHHYDLCLFDEGDNWLVRSGSVKGEKILDNLHEISTTSFVETRCNVSLQKYDPPKCNRSLSTHDIKDLFEKNEIWQQGAKDCLSCGDCTTLCPTCLCFDIEDESDLAGKCGERCVKWDSCMYKDFTLVAGGHHFRGERIDRFKHRIFHKIQYFQAQYGTSMCTGCGRCIRGCPTKIDWLEMIK